MTYKQKGYPLHYGTALHKEEGYTTSALPEYLYTSGGTTINTTSDIDEGTLSEIRRKGTMFEHVIVTVDDNPGLAKGTKLYTSPQ